MYWNVENLQEIEENLQGENLQEALVFPDKGNASASSGSGWMVAELNHILQVHTY